MRKKTYSVQGRAWLVSAIVFALTAFLTYPLLFHFSTKFPSDLGDGSKYLWNLWWMKRAVFVENTNPFFTTFLYYPQGTGLVFDSFVPLWGILSLPFQFLFGLITTYNILVFLSFLLSFWGMFLLVRRLTDSSLAATFGGVFYSFSPYVFAHLRGHFNLLHVWIFPWLLYALFHFRKQPSLKRSALVSLVFLFSLFTDYYYAFYAIGITALFLAYVYFSTSGRILKAVLLYGALIVIMYAVFLYPLFLAYIREQQSLASLRITEFEQYSADLLSYFVPFEQNPLLGRFSKAYTRRFTAGTTEGTIYVGYAALFLAFVGLFRYRDKARIKTFLVLLIVLSFLLSLGPTLTILGKDYPISLPFSWFTSHETLSHLRVSSRFGVLSLFGIYLLSGFGIAYLSKKTKRTPLFVLVFFIWFMESASFPIPLERPRMSVFYDSIVSDPEHFAILALPIEFWSDDVRSVYGQTVHGKPILGGIVARPPLRWIEEYRVSPFLGNVLTFQEGDQTFLASSIRREEREELRQSLIDLNIKYILIYKEYAGWRDLHKYTDYVLGTRKVFEDDILVAYQVY